MTRAILTPQCRFILLVGLFIAGSGNLSLFQRLLETNPPYPSNLPLLFSLVVFFSLVTILLFLLICHGRMTRWILAFFVIASSQAAYYMDAYGVVIDVVMFDNILQTNLAEFAGLFSFGLAVRTLLLGLLPAWLIIRYCPGPLELRTEIKSKALLLSLITMLMILVVAPVYSGFKHFVREDKTTRKYANPGYFSYSLIKYSSSKIKSMRSFHLKQTAVDAIKMPGDKRRLGILVVGEGARADRFSLNGYARDTNPELKKLGVLSFGNAISCGTSTGESVPCMFSVLNRTEFKREKAREMENALDVLQRTGVAVIWRDNNSDSKDVATRVRYEDYQSPALNPMCDRECRDVGMLEGLDRVIAGQKNSDVLIVLHQMGNHGPEYYRRYPEAFERYVPVCTQSQLKKCTREAVDNAYDNAILYTDFFLSRAIALLKKHDAQFETMMLYVSDHGESLGENGIYLHAAPYETAPIEQKHIPVILWLGAQFGLDPAWGQSLKELPVSHDDLFCTLMAGYRIQTQACSAWENALRQKIQPRGSDFAPER